MQAEFDYLYLLGLSLDYSRPWSRLKIQKTPNLFGRLVHIPGTNEMGDFRMQLLGTKGQRLVGKLDYGL
jgi:hypothetical protein